MSPWQELRRTAQQVERARRRAAQRAARPLERLDAPFALLAVGLFALFVLAGLAGALTIDRMGFFDPAVMRALPDDRILTNMRDYDAPIVDAVALGNGSGDVLIGRNDGTIHRLEPSNGLIAEETLPKGRDALISPLAALSAGCGWLGGSSEDCPSPDRAFALSDAGGLAMRDADGDWSIMLPDRPWIGLEERPVQQRDVQAWAVSDSGRWLLIDAGTQGAALFDQSDMRWIIPGNQQRLADGREAGPLHIVPDGERFVLGTARGLGELRPGIANPTFEWSADQEAAVLDLDRTAEGQIVALLEGPCDRGGEDCLSIERIDAGSQRRLLVGEQERDGALSADSLHHATMQNGQLVTLGAAGIHSYDPEVRSWRRLAAGLVDSFHATDAGETLVAAIGERIVKIQGARIAQEWNREGAPFRQIELMRDGGILALDAKGRLLEVTARALLTYRDTVVPDGVLFLTGAAVGNTAVLLGSAGALVHDLAARRFSWIPSSGLPSALKAVGSVRLIAADDHFWLVPRGAGQIAILSIQGSYPNLALNSVSVTADIAPLQAVFGDKDALWAVANHGEPFSLRASGPSSATIQAPVGDPRNGRGRFITATAKDPVVIFADDQQVWRYDIARRDWKGPTAGPAKERIRDLSHGTSLYALTESGRVLRQAGSSWQDVLRAGPPAGLSLSDLSDARRDGTRLYLAGAGVVQHYDVEAKQWGKVWGGGSGPVRIVDLSSSTPVWLSNGVLRLGDKAMTSARIEGAWRGPDGIMALARAPDGSAYTMLFQQPRSAPICTHRGAPAPRSALVDAIALPDDRILAVTESDAYLYVPAQRRWLTVSGLPAGSDLRLYISGRHLIAVTPTTLHSIALAGISLPDSCANPRLTISMNRVATGRAVEVSEDRASVALLLQSGEVQRWRNGTITSLLPAPTQGPRTAGLRSIVQAGGRLLFADNAAIWSYSAESRTWKRYPLSISGRAATGIEVIDIVPSTAGSSGVVTAWASDGRSYGGTWQTNSNRVALKELTTVRPPRIASDPAAIEAVSMRGGLWAIGSDRGMEIGSASATALTGRIDFPAASSIRPRPYDLAGQTLWLSGQPSAPEQFYFLPKGSKLASLKGRLAALAFGYRLGSDRAWGLTRSGQALWRIDAEGKVLSCPLRAGRQATGNCKTVLAKPTKVDPAKLDAAFGIDGYVLLLEGGKLIRVEATYRNPVPIIGPATGPRSQLFSLSGRRLLWEGPGGALWQVDVKTARATRIAEAVTQLAPFRQGLAILSRGRLFMQKGSSPAQSPKFPNGSALRAASNDWRRDAVVYGIDAKGRPVSYPDGAVLGPPMDQANRIRRLLRGPRALWLQRDDGSVQGLSLALCSIDTYGAPFRPCWRKVLAKPYRPELGESLLASPSINTPVLHFDNTALRVDFEAGRVARLLSVASRWKRPDTLPNDAASLQRLVDPTSGELAPPRLLADSAGYERLDDGSGGLLAIVSRRLEPWVDLNAGWIAWDQQSASFGFQSATGTRIARLAGDAIRNGRFLPAHAGRAVANADGGHVWVNDYGLWRYAPNQRTPQAVHIAALPQPVSIAGGKLLLPGRRSLNPSDGRQSGDTNSRRVALGALTFTETLRQGRLVARVSRDDGTDAPAFATQGFWHDQRSGIGWIEHEIALTGPAGIAPAQGWSGFDAGPPRPANAGLQRLLTDKGQVLARSDSGWFERTATGRWIRSADPFARRDLLRAAGMIWSLRRQGLSIRPVTPQDRWRSVRTDLNFAVDQLIALAATPNQVLLATRLGTHALAAGRLASEPGPAATTTVPARRFDALELVPGDPLLFAPNGARTTVWDTTVRDWQPSSPGREPWILRQALKDDQFNLALAAASPPVIRRRVDLLSGSHRWAGFNWVRGGYMPFDRATALHALGRDLYIGTHFGLRRLSQANRASSQIFDIAHDGQDPANKGPAAGIAAIGQPASKPNRSYATTSDGSCVSLDGKMPRRCDAAVDLTQRHVARSPLWIWTKSEGAVEGRYPRRKGSALAITPDPRWYWPHDRLLAALPCGGTRLELWQDGETLRSGTPITGDSVVLPSASKDLYCQDRSRPLGNGTSLPSGAYALGSSQVLQRRSQSWQPVGSALAGAVRERAEGRLVFDGGRLKLLLGARDTSVRYRLDDDNWRLMPWRDGLPALDTTLASSTRGSDLDRITPLGLVRRPLGRQISIDPETLNLATLPDPGALLECRFDRIARLDGRSHAVPAEDGAPLQLRCLDGRLVHGGGKRASAIGDLSKLDEDPFAKRELIGGQLPWTWTRIDDVPGQAPWMDIAFKDEPLNLSAGRLDIDDLRSLAAPFPGRMELISARGWWRHPLKDLGLFPATRSTDISAPWTVSAVTSDRAGDTGSPLLCLVQGSRRTLLDTSGKPATTADCADWRGRDRFWRYRQTSANGPEGLGRALNGPEIRRSLEDGRLKDLVATGAPLVASHGQAGRLAFPNSLGVAVLDGPKTILGYIALGEGMALLTPSGPHSIQLLLTRSGPRPLDQGRTFVCPALGPALRGLPEAITITRAETREANAVRLFLQGPSPTPRLVRLACDGTGAMEAGALQFDVGERVRFFAELRSLPNVTGKLILQITPEDTRLSDGYSRTMSLSSELPPNSRVQTLLGIDGAREALVVTARDVFLLDSDAAISALADPSAVVLPRPTDKHSPEQPPVRGSKEEQADERDRARSPTTEKPRLKSKPLADPLPLAEDRPGTSKTAPAQVLSSDETETEPVPSRNPSIPPPSPGRVVPTAETDQPETIVDLNGLNIAQRKRVQRRLQALNFYSGKIDGIIGGNTRSAVRSFQGSILERQSGRLTDRQLRLLLSGDTE